MTMIHLRAALALVSVFIVSGCGGGGGSTPPPPTSTPIVISGFVFASSAATNGNITAYDYSGGVKDAVLANGAINSDGSYLITISSKPGAVLLEATSLCYSEIAYYRGATLGTVVDTFEKRAVSHCPYSNNMSVVVPAVNGSVHITPYTHAALGLIQYRVAQGEMVAAAITLANDAVSTLVGLNVITTRPMPSNIAATGTPGEVYGSLCGGISSWLLNVAMIANAAPSSAFGMSPYTTINMAEAMRNDLAHDGLLNGMGTIAGSPVALSIGVASLNANIYRHEYAAYAITRVRGDKVSAQHTSALPYLSALVAYNDRVSTIYAGATAVPLDENGPVIFLANTSGETASSNYPVAAWSRDIVGMPSGGGSLYVDSNYYDFCAPDNCQSSINTTIFSNGIHLITFRSTNLLGKQSSASVSVNFSN